MIVSPCISICKTDPDTGYCYGCGRTDEEKVKCKSEETTADCTNQPVQLLDRQRALQNHL